MSSINDGSQSNSNKERPAALVVCSYLGWPIIGGVAAAIRQLIYLLHAAGCAIYCTAFKVKNDEQNEFREYDVKLIYPNPPKFYRRYQEDISWLHNHKFYFPEINEIERVKMVFGFNMVTSYQALAIRNDVFPNAPFYLVNPYKLDTPLSILGYDEKQREDWVELTEQSSKDAKVVFSIGSEIFKYFKSYYECVDAEVNHRSLKLTPAHDLFKVKRSSNIPESGNFQILMFVDENDIKQLSSESIVAKAMNYVADCLHKSSQEPPKWIIVSIPKGREDDIKRSLDPHAHLEITCKSFKDSKVVTLLRQSHLVIVSPSSLNSINLSLSTIATGTPLLVPQYSPSHKTVMEYLPDLDPAELAVDMKSGHTILGDKIKGAVLRYSPYLKRALEMRDKLEKKVNEVINDMESMMVELIYNQEGFEEDVQPRITSVSVLGTNTRVEDNDQQLSVEPDSTGETEQNNDPSSPKEYQHKPCSMRLSMNVEGGAPENGKSMAEIENDLFRHASTETNAHSYMDKVTNIHPELTGEGIDKGSLNFIIRCGSEDAADALWNAYSSARLDRMADMTFLSIPILDDVGARMLSLETSIDYQEYLQCKQDIKDKETATRVPDTTSLSHQREKLDDDVKQSKVRAIIKERHVKQMQINKDHIHSTFIGEGKDFHAIGSKTLDEWLNLKIRSRHLSRIRQSEVGRKLGAQRDELHRELTLIKEKMDAQRQKLSDQVDGVKEEITLAEKEGMARRETLSTKLDELTRERSLLEESNTAAKKILSDHISELNKELTSHVDAYNTKMKRLNDQHKQLTEDRSLINERISKTAEIDELISSVDQINQGIVPKDTVRRLSRQGNGPGEVWWPWGLTMNQNEQVVVSDYGDGAQPGSVKTVTADTAQIISTITFHGLPNTFRPTDVKMSKNNLYYIADNGNKCILVCDAKSRLKQIIAMGELKNATVCLGPDGTVFVAALDGNHVFKYSKAGEMISSKQLSKPWYLTMNSKNQLIVSCNGEHCIYVLDSNLNTLHTFGHEHLVKPCGVSVDAIGENIYVADENKVKIFSAQGEYLTDVTVDGEPTFIAVFADGRIVYTDSDDTVRVIYT